jgi:hypothetical protein
MELQFVLQFFFFGSSPKALELKLANFLLLFFYDLGNIGVKKY